ncbi:MAG: alanine racemase, partial [Candidatus Binatia bacterium]
MAVVASCSEPASSLAAASAFTSGPVAHIDTTALQHNLGEVRRLVGPGVAVLAMVKSDAYGHGAAICAQALAAAGCSAFGVATTAEAAAIAPLVRAAASSSPRIVVFGGLLPEEAAAAVAAGAEVATQEIDVVKALGACAAASGT